MALGWFSPFISDSRFTIVFGIYLEGVERGWRNTTSPDDLVCMVRSWPTPIPKAISASAPAIVAHSEAASRDCLNQCPPETKPAIAIAPVKKVSMVMERF